MRDGIVVCPVDMDGGRIRLTNCKDWIEPPEMYCYTKYSMPFEGALAFMKQGYEVRRSCWPENDVVGAWSGIVLPNGNHVRTCLLYKTEYGECVAWTPKTDDLFAGDWVVARRTS